MPIILVRHGEAVGSQGDDSARYLTYRGRSESRKVALALKERGLIPTQIVASPLVRAVQTAEIFAHALAFEGTLTTEPALVPDGDASLALKRIPISAGVTLVVTHEPIVRLMAALLVQQPTFAAFRTSGVAMFEGTRVTLTMSPETA
jgi:phosphohistidine phosphatase